MLSACQKEECPKVVCGWVIGQVQSMSTGACYVNVETDDGTRINLLIRWADWPCLDDVYCGVPGTYDPNDQTNPFFSP
jgi:hypothetical protein